MHGEDIIYKKTDIEALEFSETDKEFIKLVKKFFNELATNAKEKTDINNYGVSNVSRTGDYIPVRVSSDVLYSRVGEPDMFLDLFNVYNPSFNKEVKPNAKNKVVVENIYDVVNKHARQMSIYVGYSTPIRAYNRIMNTSVGEISVKQMLMEIDPDFQRYVNKLLKDAQGLRQYREGFDKFLDKIRSFSARAALGFNPKVVTTQFLSLFASKGIGIQYKNILKGAKKALKATKADYDLMYKYVPMAWVRANSGFNAEIGFFKEGQGIIGKTNKWLDKSTKLIEKVDSWVVFVTWNAALEQTKSQYKPYSEAHYKAAAKLTHNAVVKTQANYISIYRPEILRSQSSFLQLSTMYMGEPLQQFSQAVETIDKVLVANYIIKNSKNPEIVANAQKIKNQALNQARNAFTMLAVNSILAVAITQVFKYLTGRNDEEDPLGDISNDFLGIVTGMFPFVRDIHSYLDGYDITNMYYTGLTTIANALKDATSLLSGDAEDTARNMRRTLIGVSQIFGIPLRNLETYAKGVIGLFSPSARYKYEDLFYRQSYAKDLQKAVEKGDDNLADTIIDLMLNDKGIGKTDEKARAEILKLYAAGESVLPSGVPKTVNINGEERKLTEAERRQITNIYSQADITKLVNMPEYSKLTSAQKARAIKIVYDIYKDKSYSSVLGLDISKRALMAYAIDPANISVCFGTSIRYTVRQKTNNTARHKPAGYISGTKVYAYGLAGI